jgi:endonuclease G, mitochondrial
MFRLRGWHLTGLLPLLWFCYHVWSETNFRHPREPRFTGRTATEDWAPPVTRNNAAGAGVAPETTVLLPTPPAAAVVHPAETRPLSVTGLPVRSERWPIQVLRNAGYTVGYSSKVRLPLWVYFRLDADHASYPRYRRPHIEFFPDERVPDPVSSSEYVRSGYQRGHLATSATIGIYFGSAAQAETFRLTNIVPQVGWHNEGIWNTLERIECDDYPRRYGFTQSVCGPVLGSQMLGRLPIPRALYKIIERPDGKCLAFLIPQDGGEIPPSELDRQLTSVAEIERETGLIFAFVPQAQKGEVPRRRW